MPKCEYCGKEFIPSSIYSPKKGRTARKYCGDKCRKRVIQINQQNKRKRLRRWTNRGFGRKRKSSKRTNHLQRKYPVGTLPKYNGLEGEKLIEKYVHRLGFGYGLENLRGKPYKNKKIRPTIIYDGAISWHRNNGHNGNTQPKTFRCPECGAPTILAFENDVYSRTEFVCKSCGIVID